MRDVRPADLVFDPTFACRGARSAQVRIIATSDLLSVGSQVAAGEAGLTS